MNISIGENIKKLRARKGVTQERLAESLGVTPQAISRWESESGYPAIEYLPDLAGFFGISVDELLGINLSEREARREEIYTAINENYDEGGYTPAAIAQFREYHAEFPSDMKITLSLAKALCSEMLVENPNKALLREAEKILRGLIRQADDYDFRFACIKELAVLYKEAWQDEDGYKEVLNMLPSLTSCREVFITDFFNGANQNKDEIQNCLLTLALHTVVILRDYVAFLPPNEEEKWGFKIGCFEWMIDFCKHIAEIAGGEKAFHLDTNIAVLYRYIATYYIAQGKKSEALTSLERMLSYVEMICSTLQDTDPSHNFAWYFLEYMDQDRYALIREEPRFIALKDKLVSIAK